MDPELIHVAYVLCSMHGICTMNKHTHTQHSKIRETRRTQVICCTLAWHSRKKKAHVQLCSCFIYASAHIYKNRQQTQDDM